MDIYGFFHVAIMGNWEEVYAELISEIEKSGLLEKTTRVYLGVLGPTNIEIPLLPKMQIVGRESNVQFAESYTLSALKQLCHNIPNFKIWYVHTKGVSRANTKTELTSAAWRRYLSYFVIRHHAICDKLLDSYDACGPEWWTRPQPHFRGNFWWANSSYIRRLPSNVLQPFYNRYAAEWNFIGRGNPKIKCLHNSGIYDLYQIEYYGYLQKIVKYGSPSDEQ